MKRLITGFLLVTVTVLCLFSVVACKTGGGGTSVSNGSSQIAVSEGDNGGKVESVHGSDTETSATSAKNRDSEFTPWVKP